MQVPLLELQTQYRALERELKEAVLEVLAGTSYILGAKVEELEKSIARYCGVAHGIGLSSGTDALLISLMALNVGPADIVLTSDYSFFATAGAVSRLGATPVFIDIDPKTYNLSPILLQRWFEEHRDLSPKVRAIIPVHLYGQCAEMDEILRIAAEHHIPVIEDAAQAIGSKYPSRHGLKMAGSMGMMGCLSFFPSKNLGGIGDGGMVVTNDNELARKLRALRNHGAEQKYYHTMVGGNFRLDAIQAAALLVKFRYLEAWHNLRRENASFYDQELPAEWIFTPALAYTRDCHIYNQYVISVRDKRDELRTFLSKNGIATEVYYPLPFHRQECFRNLGHKPADFPASNYAAAHTLALPIYPELTREMQGYVVEKIGEFWK